VDLIQSIVYGIIQGVTEWLPISSTAHLRIVPALLGWNDPGAGFTAVIQLGTLAAVLIYFRQDLWRAFSAWLKSLTDKSARDTVDAKMGWAIVIGTIPIVILGVLFRHSIESSWRSLYVIATMLAVVGVFMLVAEKVGTQHRKIGDVKVVDGAIVGLAQAVALIPGAIRSGSTLVGGLLAGFDRATAARFSFLLSVPSVLAAGLKEFWDYRHDILGAGMVPTAVATVISFIVGYATISFLLGYLAKRSTAVFVGYRIALAALLFFLLGTHRLDPMQGIAPAKLESASNLK